MKGFSIYKNVAPNGRESWRYQVDLGQDEQGNKVRLSRSGFRLEREAADAMHKAVQEHSAGRVKTVTTLAEYMASWLPYHTKAKPLEPTTAARYGTLAAHATRALGSVKLADLTNFALDDLYVKLCETLAPKTVREVHNVIHVALKRAVKTKLLPFNPATGCDLPRVEHREATALSSQQLAAYQQAAAGSWVDLLIRLAAALGARRGELLAARWSDMNWTTNQIRIERSLYQVKGKIGIKTTKGRRARNVTIPQSLVEYLKIHREAQEQNRALYGPDYRADLDLIFCTPEGEYRKPDSVSWAACDIAHRAGFGKGVSLHSLRHTHASQLLAAGVPIANVSQRLGHRDPYITAKIYQHALPDTDQDVAATWDKLMAENAAEKLLAQTGTNNAGAKNTTH